MKHNLKFINNPTCYLFSIFLADFHKTVRRFFSSNNSNMRRSVGVLNSAVVVVRRKQYGGGDLERYDKTITEREGISIFLVD